MKTCSKCNQDKPLTEFHKQTRSKDGYQPACKSCMNVAYNNSRKKKQGHYQEVARQRQQKNVDLMREWKESRGCQICGENFGPCLELHHTDPSNKEDHPSGLISNSFQAFLQEAEKCVVLCANCHRKVHHGALTI